MLKNRFPEARINFLVKKQYAPLIRGNPHIHQVWMFSSKGGFLEIWTHIIQIRSAQYDAVIDLQSNLRSWCLRVLSGSRQQVRYRLGRWRRFLLVHFRKHRDDSYSAVPLKYLETASRWGVEDDGGGLELVVEKEAMKSLLSKLDKMGIQQNERIIAMAPGSTHRTKQWPVERFTEVAQYFIKNEMQIVLIGGQMDQEICRRIEHNIAKSPMNLASELSLQETAALLNVSSLLITNDTGVMHMASALGKPVVALFGPTTRHLGFFPFRTPYVVVERPVWCRPCAYHGSENCPQAHFQCMEQIHSSDVVKAATDLLENVQ